MGGCSSRGFRSPLDLVPPFLELVVVAPPISSSTAAAGAAAAIAAATAGSVVGSSADMGGVKAMDRPFVVQAPPVVPLWLVEADFSSSGQGVISRTTVRRRSARFPVVQRFVSELFHD
jgi:hypothetical protein